MRYLKSFLLITTAFISLSYTTRTSSLSGGINLGDTFTDIQHLDDVSGIEFSVSDLRGQKVLVNLWAAYDASSRKENVMLENIIEKENYPLQMVSISFDKSKSVFEKTIEMDKVDKKYQFIAKDYMHADLYERFKLKKGFKNYLIDENGIILAINVNANELAQLLKKDQNN